MQARYYDPFIGRFYSNDPVGFKSDNIQSFGRYIYGNNNPYRYIDPDGMEAQSFFIEGKSYENLGQAVAGAWGDLRQSLDNQTQNTTRAVASATRQGTVSALRTTSTATDVASKGALIASLVAPPAAEVGLALTGVSLATGVAADLIEGNPTGEQFESAGPAIAGQVVTVGLKAAKVPAPLAEHVGNRVEALGTVAETIDDINESKL